MGNATSRGWLVPAAMLGGALAILACGSFGASDPDHASTKDADASDIGVDGSLPEGATAGDSAGPVANCNTRTPFRTSLFFPATSPLFSARLGVDGLLYVSRAGALPTLGTTRFTDGGIDTIAPILQPPGDDEQAMLSGDGLVVVFQSRRGNAVGPYRLWYSARTGTGAELQPAMEVPFAAAPSATTELQDPWLTPQHLYFASAPSSVAAKKLQVGDLDPTSRQVTNVVDLFEMQSPSSVEHPVLSHDELELFYSENGQIKRATRQSTSARFQLGAVVPELPLGASMTPTWISPDDCDLYWLGVSGPNSGLFRASRR
jgi:hypothetical protein